MQERLYLIDLYDYYGELLTDKQKIYFEDYYFNNLSLAEISENYDISRNAIHKQLKEVETKLLNYEEDYQPLGGRAYIPLLRLRPQLPSRFTNGVL